MKELKQSGPYTVGIGYQDFGKIRRDHIFYVDKSLRKESKVVQTKKQL